MAVLAVQLARSTPRFPSFSAGLPRSARLVFGGGCQFLKTLKNGRPIAATREICFQKFY